MEDSRKVTWMMLVGSGIFAVLVAMDLVNDYQSGSTGRHLILRGYSLCHQRRGVRDGSAAVDPHPAGGHGAQE